MDTNQVVLRPRWRWRLAAAGALAFLASVASGAWFILPLAMILYCNLAVWRQCVRLEGAVLRQQHTIRPGWPVAAHEIVGITLQREHSRKEPWPHLRLRIWLPDGGNRAYSRRWWGNWASLLGWLEENCTETGSDGVRRWTIGMNEETASRLARSP